MRVHGKLALFVLALTGSSALLAAAPAKEEPVGLLLTATGSKVLRASSQTPLAARAGDVLFSGDELRTESGSASFLYCPGKTSQTLDPGGDLVLDAKQLNIRTGKLSGAKPVNSCYLPQLVRVDSDSQQHYGVAMSRGIAKADETIPLSALNPEVLTEIEPLETALGANPGDTAALVREAAIYDRNNLEAFALTTYRKIAALWPDTPWVNGRIFELTESLQAQAAKEAAATAADAKTFVLLVGVSRYQKLPQDLWLRYADADAVSFRDFLSSPRGGAVPADQMTVLTNEAATNGAVRNAFQNLTKRAGSHDIVVVLVVGHGATDASGSYLLAYDSDPDDLASTALNMTELQSMVNDQRANVRRMIFLADVVHAASIRNLKTSAVGSSMAALGDSKGNGMLGLLATTAGGTSTEGAEFGGGHGAFTFAVLKGLNGDADTNHDGIVDAAELTDYVRAAVSTLTNRKQRPRDFGEIEPTTTLSELNKPGIAIE
jgi:hypothetical protein